MSKQKKINRTRKPVKCEVVAVFDEIHLHAGSVDILLMMHQARELARLLDDAADHAEQYEVDKEAFDEEAES